MKLEKIEAYEGANLFAVEEAELTGKTLQVGDETYVFDKEVGGAPAVFIFDKQSEIIEYRGEIKSFVAECEKDGKQFHVLAEGVTGKQLSVVLVHVLEVDKALAWDVVVEEKITSVKEEKPAPRKRQTKKK